MVYVSKLGFDSLTRGQHLTDRKHVQDTPLYSGQLSLYDSFSRDFTDKKPLPSLDKLGFRSNEDSPRMWRDREHREDLSHHQRPRPTDKKFLGELLSECQSINATKRVTGVTANTNNAATAANTSNSQPSPESWLFDLNGGSYFATNDPAGFVPGSVTHKRTVVNRTVGGCLKTIVSPMSGDVWMSSPDKNLFKLEGVLLLPDNPTKYLPASAFTQRGCTL